MPEIKEYIGLLLWQQEKQGVMEKVEDFVKKNQNLKIISTIALFLSPIERADFVRKVYEGEDIPDDNPKIKSESHINFVIIEDTSPKYEDAITSSGKNVNLNINGYNLKKYVREFYHWKYLHSTDDLNQFQSIVQQVKTLLSDLNCTDVMQKAFVFEDINLSSVSYFHISSENTKFKKTKIIDSPHYNFVKDYLELNEEEFYNSDGFNNYLEYLKRESEYHGESNHSADNFIKLIDNFDFKKYHLSDIHQLIRVRGITWSSIKIEDSTETDDILTQRISEGGCCSLNFPHDKKFVYYDLFNCRLTESKNVQMDLFEKSNFISNEYFMNDGLHRASILAYRAPNKQHRALLIPNTVDCLKSSTFSCEKRSIESGYYLI